MLDAARATAGRLIEQVVDSVRRHRVLGEIYELIDGSFGDFARDHGPMYAGALAFYAILSLIPFIILIASLSGFALAGGGQDGVEASLQDLMVQMRKLVPFIGPGIEGDLRGIIEYRKKLGVVGFFALLLAASEVFRAVEFALARIFARSDHEEPDHKKAAPRSYLASKLLFGAFLTALVLTFIAVRLSAGLLRVGAEMLRIDWLAALLVDPFGNSAIGSTLTALGIIFGFVAILKVFAHRNVAVRFALVGGVLFYVLFEAAQVVYDTYVERFTNIGAMYGSFATLIIVVVWIYYSATLLLLCFHVTKAVQRRMLHGPRWPKDKLTLW